MNSNHAIRMLIWLALGAASVTLQAVASVDATWRPQAFSRYEGIISRMPFGAPPPAGPTAAELAAAKTPPPPFASALVLCALNRTPSGGLAIGFMDNSQKPAKSYYLERGESSDGFTVTSASFEQESATIEKEGVSVELKMAKGATGASAKPAPTPAPAPVALPAPAVRPAGLTNNNPALASSLGARMRGRLFNPTDPNHWPMPGNVRAIDGALSMGIQQESYVERLKQRREELVAKDAENTAAKDKEAEDRAAAVFQSMLRRQNMEAIRSGQGSLGIPLTPEEDAQLVNEGVLPAQQ